LRCRNDPQRLEIKGNPCRKPLPSGNETRQNSSFIVKTIVKTGLFMGCGLNLFAIPADERDQPTPTGRSGIASTMSKSLLQGYIPSSATKQEKNPFCD
jgi:hypothetical protein